MAIMAPRGMGSPWAGTDAGFNRIVLGPNGAIAAGFGAINGRYAPGAPSIGAHYIYPGLYDGGYGGMVRQMPRGQFLNPRFQDPMYYIPPPRPLF
jgi:hypothetical protein